MMPWPLSKPVEVITSCRLSPMQQTPGSFPLALLESQGVVLCEREQKAVRKVGAV